MRYDEIAKLFLRLNRTNTTLNPQELRNAEFNGEFLRLAEEIAQNEFWDNYKIFTQSDIRRMQDIQFISTLLIFLRMGIEQDNTQNQLIECMINTMRITLRRLRTELSLTKC